MKTKSIMVLSFLLAGTTSYAQVKKSKAEQVAVSAVIEVAEEATRDSCRFKKLSILPKPLGPTLPGPEGVLVDQYEISVKCGSAKLTYYVRVNMTTIGNGNFTIYRASQPVRR